MGDEDYGTQEAFRALFVEQNNIQHNAITSFMNFDEQDEASLLSDLTSFRFHTWYGGAKSVHVSKVLRPQIQCDLQTWAKHLQ